ncbi:MAG: hypothetical protein HRU11_03495 [Parvularculaceae bacterium]|nr:hypothetical protein [Parvularculaceae bacterium]
MAIVLITIVISGFSVAAFQRPGGPLAVPLFLHLHGALFLSWFILLAVQAGLISVGAHAWHKRLGMMSLGVAIAIVIVGYLVVANAVATPGAIIAGRPAPLGAIFPVLDILGFALFFSLGFLNRGNAAAHKRLMLIATLMMIDAAMARLDFSLGLPGMLILAREVALYLALIVYDLISLRRPHWASVLGLAAYLGAFAIKVNVAALPWWPQFVEIIFG